ncbi:helix-turn-helix domain-containing protein [Ihubacter sp. rT4E-8]|uniref:helix-turn-helix domain-containing protein n=1 Tax=Ihubacter sp. rT4E-8 TaxID=3242369 RepID=UPI00137A01BD
MKTWNDYKDYVQSQNPKSTDIEDTENLAAIISTIIKQRTTLGMTQRELAALCGIPQSSVARIESLKTTPNLNTLLKILRPLGLTLTVSATK